MQLLNELYKMDKDFTYKGNKTNQISFPLGGIGSGSIGLAGNGRLIDWEIFNRPNKNSYNGFSFFAIKAEHNGEVKVAKVLNGDLHPQYSGTGKGRFSGFGFGVERESLAGFPHFKGTAFKGEYPFGEISFIDDSVPLDVKLTAFNPLIPLNDKDSSIPVAILTYKVTNTSNEQLDISLVGNLSNPFTKKPRNEFRDYGAYKGIKLNSTHYKPEDREFGDLTLSTDAEDVSYQTYWYRGDWFDNLTVFWKEFAAPGKFKERDYNQSGDEAKVSAHNVKDVCLLSAHQSLAPGESGEFRFIISWSFPNYVNFWNPGTHADGTPCDPPSWKNYYATLFEDSVQSAAYVWQELDRLYRESLLFKETLFASTLPDYVVDAVASNISILKSPTCLRLTDGTLYGFEGVHAEEGSCEGTCTHVWNYEQVTPFLFPSLARSMIDVRYKAAMYENGKVAFRLMLPVERTIKDVSDCAGSHRAAADGQMGTIMRVYREWKISGDDEWLKSIWPKVKTSLEYAWNPSNTDWWDQDCDGVMEGVQHHTLDVEIYGPNSYVSGLYQGALRCAAEMAEALGDEAGQKYMALYENGRKWVDEHLFNGEFYHQLVNLQDERFPIDEELGEIKYQIGEGCHIDQVLGQWHAHIVGLGYMYDQAKVKKALESVYRYNFIETIRDYPNACRIYSLNDEQGILISSWPKGNSPKVPVPYADEMMHGFEYQAACHMIYEGMLDEGLRAVKAIRDRYDGERRNPWNELECGSNYVRSMASYSLLLALSGFEYDSLQGHIGFSPKLNAEKFSSFWSLNQGWGKFEHANGTIRLEVNYGQLQLNSFSSDLLQGKKSFEVFVNGAPIPADRSGNVIRFHEGQSLSGSVLAIVLH
ncbi:GH116 family glycosyl-hydrolase [Paenibacillus taihuensis]|uniref:GH116 family glycosyl-hydrolase n=1 Tax=Paenibacillus taihuensis TaxID=1156355 RepID=UPI001FE5F7BA|nr:GH116 family glycosyl-hydrolase [Paenibacillus taihuensis]